VGSGATVVFCVVVRFKVKRFKKIDGDVGGRVLLDRGGKVTLKACIGDAVWDGSEISLSGLVFALDSSTLVLVGSTETSEVSFRSSKLT
jgi:hypothetical protein